jgi:hypothetical protein
MRSRYFKGKRVSAAWFTVLTFAAPYVSFQVNSGRRTLAEQWVLYRAWLKFRQVLAAFPNPNAPHIKLGRPDHALDVDQYVGDGTDGLMRWLAARGCPCSKTVSGEGWHFEADSRTKLVTLAFRIRSLTKWRGELERARSLRAKARNKGGTKSYWYRHWDARVEKANKNIALRKRQMNL